MTRNGETIEGRVIYIDSSEVRVSFPDRHGIPSIYKAREIQELRFPDDKLTYDQNSRKYISAADEQAKRNGRVRVVNKSKQEVQLVVRSFIDHIGDEKEIDQEHEDDIKIMDASDLGKSNNESENKLQQQSYDKGVEDNV